MPKGVFPRRKNERHGHADSITYKSWSSAMSRCYDARCPKFPLYGGRGIAMHNEWRHSFVAFLADVGERPSLRHSLDRYPNPDGNYEPGNVRWATVMEQRRNRRDQCKLSITDAQEIRSLRGTVKQSDLAVRYGVSRSAISAIQTGRIYEYEGLR